MTGMHHTMGRSSTFNQDIINRYGNYGDTLNAHCLAVIPVIQVGEISHAQAVSTVSMTVSAQVSRFVLRETVTCLSFLVVDLKNMYVPSVRTNIADYKITFALTSGHATVPPRVTSLPIFTHLTQDKDREASSTRFTIRTRDNNITAHCSRHGLDNERVSTPRRPSSTAESDGRAVRWAGRAPPA